MCYPAIIRAGTALAAYEAFSIAELETANPVLIVTMGDRIVPGQVFAELLAEHHRDEEAVLTMLTAVYQPPANRGKGRIVRDEAGWIHRVIEQPDIESLPDEPLRRQLLAATEGNCPLYAIRARALKRYLGQVHPANAQGQFYFTDIVEAIRDDGGIVRSVTIDPGDPEYRVLCADVTSRDDLGRLSTVYADYQRAAAGRNGRTNPVRGVASRIATGRPVGQIESIANQLQDLIDEDERGNGCRLASDQPIAIGVSGGRLRIAFMHPDMERFFGPAWQMPIGAPDGGSREQVVVLMQSSSDQKLRLHPTNPAFQESVNAIDADAADMFPDPSINDIHRYEGFGTAMAQRILADLGYFTDQQLQSMRDRGEDLPPASRWVINNMRRPFSLVANALASIRTARKEASVDRVRATLSRENFSGLKVTSTGNIPRGGFSSSSAVTVAVQNGVNALFDLGLDADTLVDLACQAEYGTGVRAGALDQATEQKGSANQGALISSNPAENYRVIETFPVPADRFRVLFPFSVDRDHQAWRWSMGMYCETSGADRLTTLETRKMTGKAAEIAALLLRMPLGQDFFPEIQQELVEHGELTTSTALHVADRLQRTPLLISKADLEQELWQRRDWYVHQLMRRGCDAKTEAEQLSDATLRSLLSGWHNPLMTRSEDGKPVEEVGVPLRAMLGYLYGEVTKNCYLMHHPREWIACVTASQRGDCCYDIDPRMLPDAKTMLAENAWEKSAGGPELLRLWLERFGATPFNYNAGLDDISLQDETWNPREVLGTNFFRGLPLIDLIEAMLKRAFGETAVAVRVNGAGQGDYFQVHVDTELADAGEVKEFIRQAVYRRFSLQPDREFVEPHPGGGAVGVRLDRFDQLPDLISRLRRGVSFQLAMTAQA